MKTRNLTWAPILVRGQVLRAVEKTMTVQERTKWRAATLSLSFQPGGRRVS